MPRAKNEIGSAVRMRAMKRDRFSCTYCGRSGSDVELEVDHIVPVSRGGSHHLSNLTTSCRQCNQGKGNDDIRPPASSNKSATHPLVGCYFHTFKDDSKSEFELQGQFRGVDGDVLIADTFSWVDGDDYRVVVMPKELVYSGRCQIYASRESFHSAWDRHPSTRAFRALR